MARSKPEVGGTYRLTGGGIGDGPGALYAGQVVTVREVVPAREPGAHDTTEDSVVVEWTEPGPVMGDDGNVTRGENTRAISVSLPGGENHPGFNDLFSKEG
jgi:hypothetical protein